MSVKLARTGELPATVAERVNGQERSLVERVFRVRRNVNCFDDVAFLQKFGVDGLGPVDILGQIQSAWSIQRAPEVKAELVAEGWTCHSLESAKLNENFTTAQH